MGKAWGLWVLGGGAELVWAQELRGHRGHSGEAQVLGSTALPAGLLGRGAGGRGAALTLAVHLKTTALVGTHSLWAPLTNPHAGFWTQVIDICPEAATGHPAHRKPPACSSEHGLGGGRGTVAPSDAGVRTRLGAGGGPASSL